MTNINHSMAVKNNAMVLKCAPTTWSVWRTVRVLVLVFVRIVFFFFCCLVVFWSTWWHSERGFEGDPVMVPSVIYFIVTEKCVYKFDFGSNKKKKKKS